MKLNFTVEMFITLHLFSATFQGIKCECYYREHFKQGTPDSALHVIYSCRFNPTSMYCTLCMAWLLVSAYVGL